MTKKEQAELEAALDAHTTARALRWSRADAKRIPPDVPCPPSGSAAVTHGWSANVFTARVVQGWSTSTSHGDGDGAPVDARGYRGGSQNGVALYSTKLLALQALRIELEHKYAAGLAAIDAQIESEQP